MNFKTKIFADGAYFKSLKLHAKNKLIKGFTTNPSILKKANVHNYKEFALKCLLITKTKPISFEVTGNVYDEIYNQAKKISSWGKNVFVKIPIVNSNGLSNIPVIKKLYKERIKINITAVFSTNQILKILNSIDQNHEIIISIFCGRIADTGRDPKKIVSLALNKRKNKKVKILWASPREVFNLYEANMLNCDIITLTDDLIKKISFYKKNLTAYSVETSKQFYNDSKDIDLKII
jgi:transaldolase